MDIDKMFELSNSELSTESVKEETVVVRKSNKKDIESILTLINSLNERDKDFLALWFKDKKEVLEAAVRKAEGCYVATINNDIVGFFRETPYKNGVSLLDVFVVDPKYRKRGIAKEMMRFYHRLFHKTMAKTNSKNKPMMALLVNFGYRKEKSDTPTMFYWYRNC